MIHIAPSILSADLSQLKKEIAEVEAAGADWIHVDVMDGQFVPNITFGPNIVRTLKKCTKLFIDVHLMIANPENWIEAFSEAGADQITVHVESCTHLQRTLQHIRSLGKKAGVALNPSTPESLIEYVLGDLDNVLVMTVNPGFAKQKFLKAPVSKISRIRKMLDQAQNKSCNIEVDGGIDPSSAAEVVKAGANVLVAGNAIFGQKDRKKALEAIRKKAVS